MLGECSAAGVRTFERAVKSSVPIARGTAWSHELTHRALVTTALQAQDSGHQALWTAQYSRLGEETHRSECYLRCLYEVEKGRPIARDFEAL